MAGFSRCIPPTSKTWEMDQPHLQTSNSHRSRLSCNPSLPSMRQRPRWDRILPRLRAEISFNTRPAPPLETTPGVDNTVVFRVWHPVESSKSHDAHSLALSTPIVQRFCHIYFTILVLTPLCRYNSRPLSFGAANDGSLPDGMSSTELTAAMSSSPHFEKGFGSDYYSPCTPVGDNTRSYQGSYNPAPKR